MELEKKSEEKKWHRKLTRTNIKYLFRFSSYFVHRFFCGAPLAFFLFFALAMFPISPTKGKLSHRKTTSTNREISHQKSCLLFTGKNLYFLLRLFYFSSPFFCFFFHLSICISLSTFNLSRLDSMLWLATIVTDRCAGSWATNEQQQPYLCVHSSCDRVIRRISWACSALGFEMNATNNHRQQQQRQRWHRRR